MTDGHPHDLREADPVAARLLEDLEREQELLDLEDRLREKAPAKEESDGLSEDA